MSMREDMHLNNNRKKEGKDSNEEDDRPLDKMEPDNVEAVEVENTLLY